MGDKHRLKPCVYLVVTVPLLPKTVPSGPMVTTVLAEARQRDFTSSSDVFGAIGGVVRDKVTKDPIPNAWVELLTPLNVRLRLARTDAGGRFRFEFMHQGPYTLRASSAIAGPVTLAIQIPSPTGDYDMVL
jgi:hypothetical protein